LQPLSVLDLYHQGFSHGLPLPWEGVQPYRCTSKHIQDPAQRGRDQDGEWLLRRGCDVEIAMFPPYDSYTRLGGSPDN
jgi:hypothetical protein